MGSDPFLVKRGLTPVHFLVKRGLTPVRYPKCKKKTAVGRGFSHAMLAIMHQ